MSKRFLTATFATFVLTGVAAVTTLATADAGGPCPDPAAVDDSPASSMNALDGRCAVEAEAYVENYQEGEYDSAVSPSSGAPSGVPPVRPGTPVLTEDAANADAPPLPPVIVVDEPGVLDDNTFVDAGDSGEVTEINQDVTISETSEPSTELCFAALGHTAEVLKGNSLVSERGITLEDLLAEATALDALGVDGAEDMVELISVAIHAAGPTP